MKVLERCTYNFVREVRYFTVKVVCDCPECIQQKADKALRRRSQAAESICSYDDAYSNLVNRGWYINRTTNIAIAPKHRATPDQLVIRA